MKAIALSARHMATMQQTDLLRTLVISACAMALIAAGQALPF